MSTVRGRGRGAVALAVLAAALAPALATGSAGADPLDDAKARVAEIQEAADAATARYHAAQTRHAELTAEIADLEEQIGSGREQADALRASAEDAALTAYKTAGGSAPIGSLDGGEPLEVARRQKLLDGATAADNAAIDEFARLTEDLDARRAALEQARVEQEQTLAAMQEEAESINAELSAAQEAQAAVEEQLAREEAARQEAERQLREREAAEAAARAQAEAARSSSGSGSPPAVVDGLVCPIDGPLSFIDSWGFPRPQGPHMGVDLMSPHGTPNVAVVSGTVEMRSGGGRPGLGVHLRGDDGNLYYYFHLSSYEGGSRQVSQGEVIGYVGNTGDASGGPTHTHFEIHPGGGGAINPYPAVRAVC